MENNEKVLKEFAKWVDDQIDFKEWIGGISGNIAESLDGHIFKFAVNYGFEKIPADYQDEAIRIMAAIMAADYDAIAEEAIEEMVVRIRTPLSDEVEGIVLSGLWGIISKIMKHKAKAE